MRIKNAFFCSLTNYKKWIVDIKIYTLFTLIFVFALWHFSEIYEYARIVDSKVSPWIFPHLFITPIVMPIYGCFALLLFSDAPFIDRHMPFVIVRTGRNSWILGQLFYILFTSFLYTLINYIITVIVFLPFIDFTSGWGKVLMTLARDPSSAYKKGIQSTILIDGSMVSFFTAIEATLISLGLFFLVTLFIGVVIFSLNLIVGKMCGIIVAGVLIFISYFSIYVGTFTIGYKVYYFSPLSWISLRYLDWYGSGDSPSIQYAVIFLIGTTLLLSILSIVVFTRKDINLSEGVE